MDWGSNTGADALEVALEMSQTGNHMSSTLFLPEIDAGNESAEEQIIGFVTNINAINTNGMMTFTVIGGDDHLPALAPNNSATIEIKLPAMGPTIRVEFQEDAYTIDEGIGNLVLEVVSIIAPGVAAPRHGGDTSLQVAVLTEVISGPGTEEDSATINVDYKHISVNTTPINVNDWTCIQDEGCTHTANVNVPILEDDKHERDEKFRYYLDSTPGVPSSYHLDSTRHIITILDNDPLVVTDVTVSSTPTGGYYDADDSIEFTVPFNGSVTVTGTPQLTFDLGGQTRQANYTSGSDTEELLFTYTVTASDADDHDGISWGANALGLNGGTIKFTSTEVSAQVAADLAHAARGPLSDHKVDTNKPTLVSAELDNTILTLTFSEALNETAPANTVFTVKVGGGTGSNPTAVSISGSVVTLTLANAVASGQTVTVSYTKPATNPLKDLSGKEADGFVDNAVSVDPPPEFPNATETFTVVENTTSGTVGMVTATDPENQTVVYSVEGTGADDFNHDFSLDSSTGAITVKSDATIDFETKSSYTVSIKATDTAGSNSAVEVTINVTNADDVGSVELSAGTPALSEPVTASVSDQDIPVTVQSWSWGRGTTRTGSFSLISGEDTASYTPVQQDLGMFLRVSASYTDSFGSGKSAQATSFAVSAIPLVNVAPEFEDASVTITIAEMIPAGSDVGPPVMAEDRNGHTVTYAIRKRGDPDYDSLSRHGDSFTIDSGTGQLKIKDQPDYERRHRYYVTVTATEPITTTEPIAATDPVGLSDSVNVMVLVTNLDDPGTVTLRSANPRVDSEVSARLRDPDGVSSEVVGWVWSRGDSMEGSFTAIAGATDDLYVPTQDDFGKYLRAAATYDDAHGPGKSAEGTSSLPVNTSQRFPVRIEILFDSSAYRAKEGGVVATVRLIAQRDHFQDVKETAQPKSTT